MSSPSPARLLVTGSRTFDNVSVIEWVLSDVLAEWDNPPDAVLVCGAAAGADEAAARFWHSLGLPVEVHRANWAKYGRRAGPIRNSHMVSLGATLCVAFVRDASAGATGCVRAARRAGIPVRMVEYLP